MKAGIKAGVAFVMDGQEVASVCVAPLKGRDRAVEKAETMPIGPDKDRTEGPAIAWVRRFALSVCIRGQSARVTFWSSLFLDSELIMAC